MADRTISPWRRKLPAILAWLPLVGLATLLLVVFGDWLLHRAFGIAAIAVYLAAFLGLFVWTLARRWEWPRSFQIGFYVRHATAATVFTVVGVTAFLAATTALARDSIVHRAWSFMGWELLLGIWLYASIAGLSYAIQARTRLREQELATIRARLQALRAQLNPHFLFNALHSLSGLVRDDAESAELALEQLGDLLRYAIRDTPVGDVTFAEEWRFTEEYLALQRLRFGERLVIETDIEPDALECAVPSFTLQPLTENAIRHGIGDRPGGGCVTIEARRENGRLTVAVRDNGVGARPEDVESATGLGLRALRERLAMRYGDDATVEISTAPGGGFRTQVTLPCEPCASQP